MAYSEALALVLRDEPLPVRMMNTIWADTAGVHDDLTSPLALRQWLIAVEVCDSGKLDEPTASEVATTSA